MAFSTDPIAHGLPHREPFLFVHEVTAQTAGEHARGSVCFPAEADFFRGHFPGEPIVPGVLLTEALAQMAGIAVGQPGRPLRLAAIRAMKFPKAARPGERILLEAKKIGETGGLWQMAVTASVEGTPVAEGVVVLGRVVTRGE